MAEVQLSAIVDLDLIKMKWRELYVSEGLNRKVVPSQPPGIYQGLRIVENTGATRQVELAPDADTGYHTAVYQSTTGYSMTYWSPGGVSIILDLSDANLNSQETIIGLEMDYTIGVDTEAYWMAFPIADWNALPSARRNEIIVLGTVQVPAGASNIVTADISYNRATYAWRGLSRGNIPWSPVLRNGGFEQGADGSTDAWYWDVTETAGTGTGTAQVTASTTHSGLHALRFSSVTSGSMTLNVRQNVHIPVVAGQLLMIRFYKKVTTTSTPGPSVDLYFGSEDGSTGTITQIPIDVSATDGSYVESLTIIEVPANTSSLKWVEIDVATTYASAPATGLHIDDVQVWVETQGDNNDLQHNVSGDLEVSGRLGLHDPDDIYGVSSALVTFSEPTNTVSVDDKDSSGTVVLDVNGNVLAASVDAVDITVTTGDLTLDAGDQIITAGDQIITAGNLVLTAGEVKHGTKVLNIHAASMQGIGTATSFPGEEAYYGSNQWSAVATQNFTVQCPVSSFLSVGDRLLSVTCYLEDSTTIAMRSYLFEIPVISNSGSKISDDADSDFSGNDQAISLANISFNGATNILQAGFRYNVHMNSLGAAPNPTGGMAVNGVKIEYDRP